MSSYNGEGYGFDGDWDQGGELAWNELDWQQYLHRNEREQARFLAHYHKLKYTPDHLDEIARRMGWDHEDWSPADASESNLEEDESFYEEMVEPEADDMEPYTVHRHPVYVVTRSLYKHLQKLLEHLIAGNLYLLNARQIGDYSATMHAGELNAVMALTALDMGDYHLAICHLKNALSALNHTMSIAQEMPAQHPNEAAAYQQEVMTCLFDLREVWLRVMRECREEARRDREADD